MENNFLTKISHEIRTPLNAIIGFGYLCQQTRLDDQQRKYVTNMVDAAKELLDNFQEILDFTKLENEEFTITPLPFNLQTVLNDVCSIAKPRCIEKSLKLISSLDPNIAPLVMGDPKNISLILQNLMSNAVKFTEKGSIEVKIEKLAGDDICFQVIDTGIGIDKSMYKKIFLPFTQVDNSHTRAYGGTGLGLAVSDLLTQNMNGHITVGPNKEGGSIFSVVLPLKVAEANVIAENSPLRDIRVLVVEENKLAQQILESQLSTLGMNVDCTSEGEIALNMISDASESGKAFQLIILSWQLPDMSGLELAQYLKQLKPCPALILRSEFNLEEVQEMANSAGIDFIMPNGAPQSMWQETIIEILEDRAKVAEEEKAAQQTEQIIDGPPRILLVEDNEINQEIAKEVLTTAHLDVDIANNGQEALDAIEKEKYSLILMDIQMPVMDGLEATRRIRAAGYTMPIIAMTAHAMLDDKDISIAAGMNAHLTKPLEPMALFATINTWLPSNTSKSTIVKGAKQEIITQRRDKLPENIEGFDIIGGLATVGGNEALYANLLKKFATRYATVNEDISNSLQANDIETAVRHAHTVRGIAANLGAADLAKAAENLERSIVHSPSMITPHLRTLVVCLTNAVSAIRESLGIVEASADTKATANIEEKLNAAEREHARYILEQAILKMELDWGHAGDTVKLLAERLQGTPIESKLNLLLQHVEDFELEEAQNISKQIQAELSSS